MQISRRFAMQAMGLLVLALAGCATGPKISSEVDPEADFEVLRRGNAITVTPLALQQTHRGALARLGSLELKSR